MSSQSLLILDTTLQGAFAGVAQHVAESDQWQLTAFAHRPSNKAAAAGISELTGEVLQGAGIGSWQDLAGIGVGQGPGSFTGIKIGLSFVSGVKQASPRLPVVGLSTLQALPSLARDVLWVLPATRTQGYAAGWYEGQPQLWIVNLANPERGIIEDAATRKPFSWADSGIGGIRLVRAWPELMAAAQSFPEEVVITQAHLTALCAQVTDIMAEQVVTRLNSDAGGLPQPLYLRRSAPEEALAKKGVSS